MVRSPAATAAASRRATGRRLLRIRWTTHVCTTVCGNAAQMASSNPSRPSQQAMRMSQTPRLRRSAVTLAQKRAPSPAVAVSSGVLASQMPSTCFSPSVSMPAAR